MRARRPLAALLLLLVAACGDGGEGPLDLAGTWLLDRDALAWSLVAERVASMPAETRKALDKQRRRALYAEARSTAGESDLRVDFLADGTFVVRYVFGGDKGARKGIWRGAGREVVLRTTHTAAGPLAEPSEVRGVLTEGVLTFPATAGVPHEFSLRRR